MLKANSFERYMQSLVNQDRAEAGMGPVKLELNLNHSAQDHSNWMLATDTFSHTGARGSTAHERMVARDFDFSGAAGSAENLAIQTLRGAPGIKDDVYDLHVALMNSPGHRANILNPKYDYVGISIEVGDFNYGGQVAQSAIVTQNFAYTDGSVDLDVLGGSSPSSPAPEGPTAGADTLEGDNSRDVIDGKGGDDKIVGKGGNDKLSGGKGDDILSGNAGRDVLDGDAGHDRIVAGGGADKGFGGGGNDILKGGGGRDSLYGHAGGDNLVGGGQNDRAFGGGGRDTVDGGKGNDFVGGGGGADKLFGRVGDDGLGGGSGDDVLYGGGGRDKLFGGKGEDILRGNAGNDTLNGKAQADKLFGGGGSDTFVYRKGNDVDIVKDFENGKDTIDLRRMGFSSEREAINQAVVDNGDTIFKFGDGDRLVIEDTFKFALIDDILV